ncbi:peptide deformylase [Roseomonas haemaphysalidis]|uniref:Peptide deformylase n=1 Tax=Roseomonas haemaphysalidis TaxID=2768162 RepID=A0ABS3KP02_9PROT|nr:peptide deformylase [Roseomonas haemaphysalidis]MBO1079152.1 peptide deformylase [Roseomonas haemaphysalidis]
MAILKIARMGHPVLLRRADPVPDARDPDIRRLIADMGETMLDAAGLGLAAPQVHVPLRLFVWRDGDRVRALVNPALTLLGPAEATGWEGCLSIPGLRGNVPRAARLLFRGQDEAGDAVEGEAEGMAARVMQHEVDHLDGVLYPMRMTDFTQFGFNEELARSSTAAAAAITAARERSA